MRGPRGERRDRPDGYATCDLPLARHATCAGPREKESRRMESLGCLLLSVPLRRARKQAKKKRGM